MTLKYLEDSSYRGIPGYRFAPGWEVMASAADNGNNYCFCPQVARGLTKENGCLKKGALDLSGCQGKERTGPLVSARSNSGVSLTDRGPRVSYFLHITAKLFDDALLLSAGIPVIVTYPHFYEADPSYLDAVEGLNPQAELHRMQLDIEPVGAFLMATRFLAFLGFAPLFSRDLFFLSALAR